MAIVTPGKHVPVQIAGRLDHREDLWSIRVRHETDFTFKPGQYATLGVRHGDRILERPYSIVSAPSEPEIEFLLELVPDGLVTPHLHRLEVGAELLMRPRAKGRFLLDLPSRRSHHLMLCTVTGVAPFLSMLRQLAAQPPEDGLPEGFRAVMVHGGSRSDEFGYQAELEAFDREHGWFTYVPTVSRHWEEPSWTGERGRVDELMRKYADGCGMDPDNGVVYLCGHPGMILVGEAVFHRRGFDRPWVRQEEYWPLGKEPTGVLEELIEASDQTI